MAQPLVSIIIGTYNQSDFLPYTLQSIINQSYTNWECIIVDDDSTDNTKNVVKSFVVKDSRFKYIHKKNEGVAVARNFGFSIAKGDYIQFLDSDDYLAEIRFAECVKLMQENKSLEMIVTNYRMFVTTIEETTGPFSDLRDYTIDFDNVLLKWDRGLGFPPHAVFLRKSAISDIRFNEKTRFKEDWLYWLSVLKVIKNVEFVDKTLAFYRINPNGKHKKSVANFLSVCTLIYNDLDELYKKRFFDRMVEDLLETKDRLLQCSIAYDDKEIEIKKLKINFFKKVMLKIKGKYN